MDNQFFSLLLNVILVTTYFVVLGIMVYKGFKRFKEAKKLKEVGVDILDVFDLE